MMNFPLDTREGRSLPNVLKRISNIVALKSSVSNETFLKNIKQYKLFELLMILILLI